MKQSLCTIVSNEEILPGVWLMWLGAPDIASSAHPGQFITVRCGDFILRRPFSIHQVVIASEAKQSLVALLFRVVGEGTLWLSQRQKGDKLDVLGPLGKGFSIEPSSGNLLLMAGGMGIAPLVFLAQFVSSQHRVTLVHGTSTAKELYPYESEGQESKSQLRLATDLPHGFNFIPVTEDGSVGKKGMATDILPDFLDWADQIYACGPAGMYRTMAKMSLSLSLNSSPSKGRGEKLREESILKKCQVSLEVRMGCGIGACYGCSINTKGGLRKVCQDGPIFELKDILWEEVRI